MRKFIILLAGTILLSGCAYFKAVEKLKVANRLIVQKDSLLTESQHIIKDDGVLIDSLFKWWNDCKKLKEASAEWDQAKP